ncbi:hypothetical protein L1887_13200 [Cichorium endivia]|nr:hypothetical protein L1887_13200 [Cichorium endivia]
MSFPLGEDDCRNLIVRERLQARISCSIPDVTVTVVANGNNRRSIASKWTGVTDNGCTLVITPSGLTSQIPSNKLGDITLSEK